MELAGIKLNNPVMVASGTFGNGKEYADLIDIEKLGAIITKSISLNPREGNPPPRICETPSGMLNSIGLQNDGLKVFIDEHLKFLSKYKVPVIVNIAGETDQECVELAKALSKEPTVKGLELNISCPNVKQGGMQFGCSPTGTEEIVKAVRKATDLPLIVKLSPNVTDIVQIAEAAVSAGADALSLINTLLGMAVDVKERKFKIARKVGGLSGPAIRPVAVRMVYQVASAVKVPVIGIGGILTLDDALEFFMVGASAVQVGTGNFVDSKTALNIIEGLKSYDLNDIKGCLL
ncbi:dihydroorotate dehydrogenase [Candidatus Saganbacteria bacterium]|nr:dihydroorotate dehydrogenase [Candidatus Saganbacteria bacterium]